MNNTFLGLIVIICFYNCKMKSDNYIEKFIIPNNYKGKVMIKFNQLNGKDIELTADTVIFRIDKNGELNTKFRNFQIGSIQHNFYYESDLNKIIPYWFSGEAKSGIGVFNLAIGEENINNKMVNIEEFFVGDTNLYMKINFDN